MFTRLFKFCIRNNCMLHLSKSKKMDKQKCYFRLIEENSKIDITFLYTIKDDIIRQFNFSRKPTETLDVVLTRISSNIQKALDKANKKNKNNTQTVSVTSVFTRDDDVDIDSTMSCLDLFSTPGRVNLKICEFNYEALFNPPWVVSLSLPKCILEGFPVYPETLEIQNANISSTEFKWFKGMAMNEKGNVISETHIKWEPIASKYNYVPMTSDIGMKLKLECLPGDGSKVGPAVEVLSSGLVTAGPGPCPFENRHMFTNNLLKEKSFRCVTYNILADLYCDSEFTRTVLHPYCPEYALQIDYRKQLFLKELNGYNADLICLQEVDSKIFKNYLQPHLEVSGFEGKFYKKAKEVAEGLSCFYRTNRFKCITDKRINLSEELSKNPCFASIWESVKDNKPLLDRLLHRSTVASATVLSSLDSPENVLVVGNTHLYFHPDADHIRLIQGGMVIYWLQDIIEDLKKQMPGKTVSLILCGDFNSVPSNGVYQLYTTGIAPSSLIDWKSNEAEAVENLTLKQSMPLGSACGTPQYTNFTAGFADCLDYIFYDRSSLKVEQVIPFPSTEELHAHTALPSVVFPSDHVASIADLKFIL